MPAVREPIKRNLAQTEGLLLLGVRLRLNVNRNKG